MRTHPPHQAGPGETVLVTGASSGIGRDAALHLSELGYTVLAGVRHESDGAALVADSPGPGPLQPLLLDVTDDDQVAAAAAHVDRICGDRGLTALFSNAGIAAFAGDTSCEGCPIETQLRVMEVNHFGAVRVTQAVLPAIRRARGRIVFNTALMARVALPFNAGYAASKAALEAWADTLRLEVHPHGVSVVVIEAAAIVSSLEGKADLDAVPDDGPYPEQRAFLRSFMEELEARADDPACSPRRFSEAVVEAIQAVRPHRRYVVGGGSHRLSALSHLPGPVQDRIRERLVQTATG